MLRFSLFGIPIQVEPFFWLTLAFLSGQLFSSSPDSLLRAALFVIAGFISVLVHELGHALTGRAFGLRSAIVLQAFGGYASFTGGRFTRPQNFVTTAAGPAVQILLGVAVIAVLRTQPPLAENALYLLKSLARISIFWAVLNLLPILPLDGGQMLNAILGPARINITLWTTIIVAVVTGVLVFQYTLSILFPIFLAMFAYQAFQSLKEQGWR